MTEPENIVTMQEETLPQKKRVWEVDFLRGILILFVVWDHLMFDFMSLPFSTEFFQTIARFATEYQTSALRTGVHRYFLIGFVGLSGVSCALSRNNWKRGVKMLGFAYGLTLCTILLRALGGGDFVIRFNVLHVIAYGVLMTELLRSLKLSRAVWLLACVVMLFVGEAWLVKPVALPEWLFFLGNSQAANRLSPGDFLPLLPYLGWLFLGALAGEKIYAAKTSVFENRCPKLTRPLEFCGRHSLAIYLGSQVAMYGILYLFTVVWGIF